MKTKDILSTGVDRNFLRKCIDKEIIHPVQHDNKWIVNKSYIPYIYSQKDLEDLWGACMYRKMGLSFEKIKDLCFT